MSRPVVDITRRMEFSASHRLHDPGLSDEENRRLYGICNNEHGHGHNYEVEVVVRGEVPDSGMVMNLNDLEALLREKVVGQMDHKHLNHDVAFFQRVVPTAENIAIAIWNEIEPDIAAFAGCRLKQIRVYESRNNHVDYFGPTG